VGSVCNANLNEVRGTVKFEDMVVGGHSSLKKLTLLLVLLTKLLLKLKTKEDASKQPRIVIVDENGESN
jgi:hypothetical protein